jgi:hypothetical protein
MKSPRFNKELAIREIINGSIRKIGFKPTFINADIGSFSGVILIRDYTCFTDSIWNAISKIDGLLRDTLEADIISLEVKFSYEGVEDEGRAAVFTINFIFD